MYGTGFGYGGCYPGVIGGAPFMGSTYIGAPVQTIVTEEIITGPSYGYGLGGVGYPVGGYGGYGGIGCGMGYPATYSTYYWYNINNCNSKLSLSYVIIL